ncbi:MAG: cysteine desulfurase family protein [Oscillospiraceae bacterium]
MPHYLDYAATAPLCPEARGAILAGLDEFGNPSSRHALGQAAAGFLGDCRSTVANALGCLPSELVFTSGGTEGDNWAIAAALQNGKRRGKHLITSAIEHAAVLEPLKRLQQKGYDVTYLPVDSSGRVRPADLQAALREDTVLVSLMLVNNELGTVQPVAECAALAHAYHPDILVHTDAVQGFLKVPFTPKSLGVDLLSISGHKIGAPKGVGGFYIRQGLHIVPLLPGGGQEFALRSGTEPTLLLGAFAAAAAAGSAHFVDCAQRLAALKAYAQTQLAALDGVSVLVQGDAPHILPFSLEGYKSEVVVRFLSDEGVYLSSGSACHKGKKSHVFSALKLTKRQLDGALRVSFGGESTTADVDALLAALQKAKAQLFQTMS